MRASAIVPEKFWSLVRYWRRRAAGPRRKPPQRKLPVLEVLEDRCVPQAGTLGFSAATLMVNESDPAATVTVSRTMGSEGVVTAVLTTSDGTATAGQDYTAVTQTLTFAAGQTSATVTVPILNDMTNEPDETVNLTLASATLGTPSTAVLTITNDDPDTPGVLNFSPINLNVAEDAGLATITVTRTGGSLGAVGVTMFIFQDGTATRGADFTGMSQSVTFAAGQTTATVTIPILSDTLPEGNETFSLALLNPTGSVTVGAQGHALVTILDNDLPTVQLSVGQISVNENAGTATVTITITRPGSTGGAESVTFSTVANGTATVGTDFTAVSQTVTFAAAQTSAAVTIPILNDMVIEPNETFGIALTNPSGAALGAISTGEVTILNDDTTATGDVTSLVQVPPATLRRIPGSRFFVQTFRITNTSNLAIQGPIRLQFSRLSGRDGRRFRFTTVINSSVEPGSDNLLFPNESVDVTVVFRRPVGSRGIRFNLAVQAGS